MTLNNSTVSGNSAERHGGGILKSDVSDLILNNVTITGNQADSDQDGDGLGGGFYSSNASTIIQFSNTIIANNTDNGNGTPECYGDATYISLGYNIIGDTSSGCSSYPSGVTGDQVNIIGDGSVTIDTILDTTLQDNGGPTLTHALVQGSPAVDAGNPAGCGDDTTLFTTDQRGYTRPVGAACDIGAFELNGGGGGDTGSNGETESDSPEDTSTNNTGSSSGCSLIR